VLAVDNMNGGKLCEQTLRVDHKREYHPPKSAPAAADAPAG
jgi:hypothetical protein